MQLCSSKSAYSFKYRKALVPYSPVVRNSSSGERYCERIHQNRDTLQGRSQGSWQGVFFQIQVSRDHLHITIYLTIGKTNCACSPNSIIIKSNITLTRKKTE